ncbi:hypothetical protein [Xanthomonas citri]|uniref:hypothetical protein n=1 Tax=Xanthomonas citri TaxID=346 RepID=UPI0012FD793A|nr:hypothetical protein [Xanthomonas citri]
MNTPSRSSKRLRLHIRVAKVTASFRFQNQLLGSSFHDKIRLVCTAVLPFDLKLARAWLHPAQHVEIILEYNCQSLLSLSRLELLQVVTTFPESGKY